MTLTTPQIVRVKLTETKSNLKMGRQTRKGEQERLLVEMILKILQKWSLMILKASMRRMKRIKSL